MTDQDIIAYYANLLILQYREKPKAYATIEALVALAIMNQLPVDVLNGFDFDTAEGDQLDVIGKYVGVSRTGLIFSGFTTLSDTDYRQVLKIQIVQNNNGSSLFDIQELLNEWFGGGLLVFDYQNMAMSYLMDASAGSLTVAEFIVMQNLLPKPMAVQLASLIYIQITDEVFGFVSYEIPSNVNITGFNTYEDYDTDTIWLDYSDAVII